MGYDEIQQLFGKAASAYAEACQKHPIFPTVASRDSEEKLVDILDTLRIMYNAKDTSPKISIRSVQSEELLEAVIEAKRGNYAAAKAETLHLIATAMRAYEVYDALEKTA